MAEIHVRREHRLGLAKARKAAWRWAELAEQKYGMECTVLAGETSDVIEFTRPGVEGRLIVEGDSFDLTAQLGFLLGAFRRSIEAGIEENLDDVLAAATSSHKAAPAKSAARKAAKKR
jgi:putative polyhydroxyalkanoate system protein